jgi:hypothetical protein
VISHAVRARPFQPSLVPFAPGRILSRVLWRAYFLVATVLGFLWAWHTLDRANDFQSFVDAGRALAAGENPYGVYSMQFKLPFPNMNPPISLFALRYLADVDPAIAQPVWSAISAVLYGLAAVAVVFLNRRRVGTHEILWLGALAGLWNTIESKNIYAGLALLAVGAWWLLRDGRPAAAGLLIGILAAIKPNLLVWPGLLLLAGHWGTAAIAGATFASLSALPALVYGPSVYVQWLETVERYSAPFLLHNASLTGLASRFGAPGVGAAASAALLLVVAAWAWRRRPDARQASGVAVIAALLAAPLAWVGYTVLLLPVLVGRRWSTLSGIGAGLLAVPPAVLIAAAKVTPPLIPIAGAVYPAGLVCLLIGLLRASAADAP